MVNLGFVKVVTSEDVPFKTNWNSKNELTKSLMCLYIFNSYLFIISDENTTN